MTTAGWPCGEPVSRVTSIELHTFEQIFAQYAPYAGRTLRFLGVDEANVEDVCQEVFIVVHRRMRELRETSSVRAWVRQICVYLAHNERRRVRRRRENPSIEHVEIATPAQQQGTSELREMRDRLLVLLERLAEDQRAVFVLYEIEQLTMAEVASAVGCPLQTAYSRLHSARARIAESIALEEAS